MIVLGIDYGKERIGVAISDEEGACAFPLALLRNSDSLMREVSALVAARTATKVVVGASENPGGAENTIRERVESFADALGRRVSVPVVLAPESYSSAEARRAWEHVRETRKTVFPAVDAAAAAIILQAYLDRGAPDARAESVSV